MVPPAFRPTAQHDWFQRSGRWFTRVTRAVADLDLPEVLPLPDNRPVILAANHRSLLDLAVAMAVFSRFGLSSRIQVRADLMEKGPGARLLHSIGAIPTSTRHRESSERASIEAVSAGHLLSLMPEGRLCRPDEWVRGVGPGRPGVSRIALATGAVVVPIGMSGTERVWPRGRPPRLQLPRPRVRVGVGAPVELASTNHADNSQQVMEAIADVLVHLYDPHAVT
ncbi:MAG: lysophospholipid acyltransferase family protein [Actinomycetota bacterium]|nr:lysophospholipid acyltransferase family protein [Actinomycetota bacterium]